MKTLFLILVSTLFFGSTKNVQTSNEDVAGCVNITINNTTKTISYSAIGFGGVCDVWIQTSASGCMGFNTVTVYHGDDISITGTISESQFASLICATEGCEPYEIFIVYKKPNGTRCTESAQFCW